ncbi:apyrase-like isoform X2 [Plutella xylostella]|uniref:apyrase-like isoform X1 n=1 Tax=Plutella xylostella TaxID=51655 RepID=UPI0020326E36|nr:apyrase-like isoform X1 [Plutella xylostella]XP_048482577.1 apyrase-like isoform X2 [Plutella xylostella]
MYKVIVLFLTAWLSVTVGEDNSDLFELNIVHFNDFHAHFDQVSPNGGPCESGETCIGGFARLFTAVKEAVEAEPDSLVLNGGDTFQGTIWYNFLRWDVSQHFMNMLPHDAHVLGNHEFDHDIDGLVPYLKALNAPMLAANVNSTLEPRMQGLYQNHTIVVRQGRRIGIIGVLLKDFSAPIGNIIMEDEVTAVNREAAILTAQGVDIIIVLSHCGYDSDQRMAARVVPEVDIIVGAHSHSLLYNGEAPSGDNAIGAYPTVVTQSSGHRIPIVQASCYTRYLGNIKFYIDSAGVVQSWSGLPIFLGTTIVRDPTIEALLEPWRQQVDAVGKEVLGRSRVSLNRSWCTQRECNMGSWAADGFLHQLMPRAAPGSWGYAHVCLINAGGLRVQINPGNVTTGSLLMAMPFENMVQVYSLRGEHLLEALEFSVGTYQEPGSGFRSQRMLQVAGLRMTVNASAPVNARITETLIRCIDCDVPRYEPLQPDRVYRVVSQDYIGDGGGGFTMLSEHRQDMEYIELDYVMLQDYMRQQGTVMQDLDGRIKIVY